MKTLTSILTLTALVLSVSTAEAEVLVNAMFQDNMVLQREMDIPIWGTADPGEAVVVEYAPLKGRLERGYLQAVSSTIAAGTSEVQRSIIATRGLGLSRG